MSHPLDRLLEPGTVAVIGASTDSRKRGHQAVRSLLESKFHGRIFPVHPDGNELLGLPVATSIDLLPEAPDLAFICTRADTVPTILEQCGERGVAGAAVPAVGFRETGEAGAELEERLSAIVRRTGIRLIGPNTSGIINTAVGLNLTGIRNVQPGGIALLSQSGNVALDIMTKALSIGTGISLYVGIGNETDVTFHECLDYLEREPNTKAILMYVEGFRDGRRFIETANRVSATKPIVLLKGGRSAGGVAAARSHTGAIAGSYPVLRAALRQHGVSEVLRSDELLAVGQVLSTQPPISAGAGIVVVSDGGGHGALATDALAELGAPLVALSDTTQRKLRNLLGPAASLANPIDMAGAGDQDPSVFEKVVEVLAHDGSVGAVFLVGLFGGYSIRFTEAIADAEAAAAHAMVDVMVEHEKTLVVHSLYANEASNALALLKRRGIPVVASIEIGARCIRAAHARGLFLAERPVPPPSPPPRKAFPIGIASARRERRTALLETEVFELLREHDVPLVPARLCRTADQVAEAQSEIGRIALKIVSPTITSKTDAGGVVLNVSNQDDARTAFQRIMQSASNYAAARGIAPDVRGVLVAPMQPEPVAEVIVGVKHDSNYGPVLTIGAGGIAVEVHGDTTLRGLPVGRNDVFEMLDEVRIARILRGFRGRPSADRERLADLVLGVAACTLSHPEIELLETNPVFVYEDRAVVIDARAFLEDLTKPKRT